MDMQTRRYDYIYIYHAVKEVADLIHVPVPLIKLVDTPDINATITCGRYGTRQYKLVITAGDVRFLSRPLFLAMLGHEFGHLVTVRHGDQTSDYDEHLTTNIFWCVASFVLSLCILSGKIMAYLVSLPSVFGLAYLAFFLLVALASFRVADLVDHEMIQRDRERRADLLGAEIVGKEPTLHLLQLLRDNFVNAPYHSVKGFFHHYDMVLFHADHPTAQARINYVQRNDN